MPARLERGAVFSPLAMPTPNDLNANRALLDAILANERAYHRFAETREHHHQRKETAMRRIGRDQLERFPAFLDAHGTGVQREFREMSPAEIIFAMEWFSAEAERLLPELTSFSAMVDEAMRGKDADYIVGADFEQRLIELQKRVEASQKSVRLRALVEARISGQNADRLLKARLHRLSLN